MSGLTHIDKNGAAGMVDVRDEGHLGQRAAAEGFLIVNEAVVATIASGGAPKGKVYETEKSGGRSDPYRAKEIQDA